METNAQELERRIEALERLVDAVYRGIWEPNWPRITGADHMSIAEIRARIKAKEKVGDE